MIRFLLVAILLVLFGGCGEDELGAPEKVWVEYQISLDRIEAPDSVAPTEPLVVNLSGIIGPNTGYWFDHADTVATDSLFDLTLFGIHDETPGLQTLSVLIEWNGRPFVKQPPHSDSVRIVVHQPDGSILENTVRVEQ